MCGKQLYINAFVQYPNSRSQLIVPSFCLFCLFPPPSFLILPLTFPLSVCLLFYTSNRNTYNSICFPSCLFFLCSSTTLTCCASTSLCLTPPSSFINLFPLSICVSRFSFFSQSFSLSFYLLTIFLFLYLPFVFVFYPSLLPSPNSVTAPPLTSHLSLLSSVLLFCFYCFHCL